MPTKVYMECLNPIGYPEKQIYGLLTPPSQADRSQLIIPPIKL
ncbi:uncharacterized protein METZ01_LOCUS162232 [marine metagenome]|uniref:Uncharacterized protein n=1 Tax=marine metagenome TaxID=408172 RepID=A0A382B6K5_9ZZZZ